MKNILVVFTGGTIGSSVTNNTINTDTRNGYKLLELFTNSYSKVEQITFKTLEPLQILSENLHPSAWTTLIEAIETENLNSFDGIIVTHGSDTLAYTAAALSLYFHRLHIPLCLIASNYPLDDTRANGLANFDCAVEFILQNMSVGVFVPYLNPKQNMQVHLGCRLTSSLQLTGDFYSAQFKNYLEFSDNTFKVINPLPTQAGSTSPVALKPVFSDRILLIKPYPGLTYNHFDLTKIDTVFHELYHSGTACTTRQWGEQHSLLAFLNRSKHHNIDVYLAPAMHSDAAYQSTRELLDSGAQMIWNMSVETAYVKLMLAYGNFKDKQEIMNFMATDFVGEYINNYPDY